jgi:hypothetical protein
MTISEETDLSGVLRKMGPEGIRLLRAMLGYRMNPVTAASRYWDLYRHRSFSPDEIHFFQLLDPALSATDLSCVVSKEELLQLQLRLNPSSLHPLTEDKLRFHHHCERHGLPVPRIHALYDPKGRADDSVVNIRIAEELDSFLAGVEADALIFKPVDGVNGEGVTRLERVGSTWKDVGGHTVDARTIAASVASSRYPRWMFQELVKGHPDLCSLSETTGLQTVRVITAVEGGTKVKILATRLRLICGNTAYDNFNYGTTGNVIANVNVESGEIFSVVGNDRGTMCHVETHPKTGKKLLGYRVPQWDAVRSLAERAATTFLPLKTVGWDVAIALPRPCLIEGNVTWGILSGEPRMGEIYRYLQSLQS